MGRGKVVLKRIENTTSRQVTFSKRRNGLLKKAFELSVLCDVEVALVIFSPTGKAFQFASHDMGRTIDRYRSVAGLPEACNQRSRTLEFWRTEINELNKKLIDLETRERHFLGEELQALDMKELKLLERQMKIGIERIRSKKRRIMAEHVNMLKIRQRALQEENAHLQRKTKAERDERHTIHPDKFKFEGRRFLQYT